MATASRSEDSHVRHFELEERLREAPWNFQFFQAVRLLQRLYENRTPIGQFAKPEEEIVRVGVHQAVSFPASQIQGMEWPEGDVPRMLVNFMGLTGPSGVLPMAYTELINDRKRNKDHTLDAFLNIFNHRIISLFYQAWEKHRFPVVYERGQSDRFTRYLMSFIGLGTEGLQNRQPVRDEALLFYTGLLAMQTRSASALKYILEDYFSVPIEIEEFVGCWCKLDGDDQCELMTGRQFSEQVGLGAVVGDEIWDQQSRARVRVGPMPLKRYRDFLPDGSAHEPLRALTRFYSGEEIEFEVQLILQREEVPSCELGSSIGLQLGWVTWMKSGPSFDRSPDDTILLLT